VFHEVGKAWIADSKANGIAAPCDAWMHFAGGETSARRPGTTRMMFLAVFIFRVQKSALCSTTTLIFIAV
jgi:hypothetical protein